MQISLMQKSGTQGGASCQPAWPEEALVFEGRLHAVAWEWVLPLPHHPLPPVDQAPLPIIRALPGGPKAAPLLSAHLLPPAGSL